MNKTWKVSECAVVLMALAPAVLDGQVQQIDKLYKRWVSWPGKAGDKLK